MIPQKIHYCWMSGEPYPELVEKCIESWKTILPEYEIIEWNKENFDYKTNMYCREAYQKKKWAFVSDFVRIKVLYDYGGIYLDSDIEVFKKFDDLLNNDAFTGFENNEAIGPWLLASRAGNPLFKMFLKAYENRHFILPDGDMDLTPNPLILTPILQKYGLVLNGKTQYLKNITIYSQKYFCPKDFSTGKINLCKDNYAIHYFNGGWLPIQQRVKLIFIRVIYKYLGKDFLELLKRLKKCI